MKVLSKTSTRETLPSGPVHINLFSYYVRLQNIYSTICEEQSRGNLSIGSNGFKRLFGEELHDQNEQSDTLDLMLLWHTAFMDLLVDFNKLESALRRDGLHCVSLESDIAYILSTGRNPLRQIAASSTHTQSKVSSHRCPQHRARTSRPSLRLPRWDRSL